MSTFDFTESDVWGGRPVARSVADIVPRGRVIVNGTIRDKGCAIIGGSTSYSCTLDDGTGVVELVFLGRRSVGDLLPGTRCRVEATAVPEGGRIVLLNPLYRVEERG